MDANTLYLRPASLSDAPALRAIYAPYVEKTAITFEYTVPDVEAFAARMRATLRRYPYLVAVRGGEIVGYAYAGAFGERAAYAWAAEVSIYLREDQRRQGIGRRLYAALEALLRAQHVQTLYACIAYPDGADDVHLTKNSAQFHAHIGYRLVGEFSRCGYKFGTWYSMVWMEKHTGAHEAVPQPVRPFPGLAPEAVRRSCTRGNRKPARFRLRKRAGFLSLLQQLIRAKQHLCSLGACDGCGGVRAVRKHAARCQACNGSTRPVGDV